MASSRPWGWARGRRGQPFASCNLFGFRLLYLGTKYYSSEIQDIYTSKYIIYTPEYYATSRASCVRCGYTLTGTMT